MDDEMNLEELKKFWDAKGEKITIVLLLLAFIGAVVCIILGISKWVEGAEALGNNSGKLSEMASLGSYLQGSTGSLWALAGFFVVFLAFLIQAIQFSEQRKQFKIQLDSMARQNFEFSFFQMLNLQNEITMSMKHTEGNEVKATGRDCFKKWYEDFRQYAFQSQFFENEDGTSSLADPQKTGVEHYESYFYKIKQDSLGHYFRNLYRIIKFVNEAEALKHPAEKTDYRNRRNYTSLVRATLSQYELALLFYNCASELGEEKFKPLVEKYGLLKNFNTDDLRNEEKKIKDELILPKAFQ